MSAATEIPIPIRPPPTTATWLISLRFAPSDGSRLEHGPFGKERVPQSFALIGVPQPQMQCPLFRLTDAELAFGPRAAYPGLCSGAAAPLAALVATVRFASVHPCGSDGAARRETAMRSVRTRDCAAFKGSSAIWSTPPTASRSSAVNNLPRQAISNAIFPPEQPWGALRAACAGH